MGWHVRPREDWYLQVNSCCSFSWASGASSILFGTYFQSVQHRFIFVADARSLHICTHKRLHVRTWSCAKTDVPLGLVFNSHWFCRQVWERERGRRYSCHGQGGIQSILQLNSAALIMFKKLQVEVDIMQPVDINKKPVRRSVCNRCLFRMTLCPSFPFPTHHAGCAQYSVEPHRTLGG